MKGKTMNNDIELRKYCLEMAKDIAKPEEFLDVSERIHKWLMNTHLKPEKVEGVSVPVIRKYSLHSLSPTEKTALRVAIDIFKSGKRLTGRAVAEEMKVHSTAASKYLRSLVTKKYVLRNGNKFKPVLKPDGSPFELEVTKCPPATARGHGSMSNAMGKIARIG